jgi:hypothetical protein
MVKAKRGKKGAKDGSVSQTQHSWNPIFVTTTLSGQIPPLVGMTASADSHPTIRPTHSSCSPDLTLVEFDPDEVTPF